MSSMIDIVILMHAEYSPLLIAVVASTLWYPSRSEEKRARAACKANKSQKGVDIK